MANCYVILDLGTNTTQIIDSTRPGIAGESYWGNIFNSSTLSFTIPENLTLIAASIIPQRNMTSSSATNAAVGNVSTFIKIYENSSLINTIYGSETTISLQSGHTYMFEYCAELQDVYCEAPSYNSTCSVNYAFSFSDKIKLTCTIPTIESIITAEKLNSFAALLNTSTVSVGNSIIRSAWQEIGTAVGNMTTAWNNSTHPSAVTFNNTRPLSTDLSSVITNMTNNYSKISLTPI